MKFKPIQSIKVIYLLIIIIGSIHVLTAQEHEDMFLEQVKGLHAQHKISALAIDDENHKYVGTAEGIFRVRAVSNVIDTLFTGEAIRALAWHKRTGLWAALENGRIRNVDTGEEVALEAEGVEIDCMTAGANAVWVGTNQGVFVISTHRKRVSDHYTTANSKLSSDQINAIYWGPYNTIWIGTGAGVVRVFGSKWQVFEKDHSFTGITETHEGVWLASEDEMWLVYQRNRWAPVDASSGLVRGKLRTLTADRKGNLYIASEILVRFNPYQDKIDSVNIADAFLDGEELAMLWDSNDELWLASSNQGLINLKKANSEEQLSAVLIVEREPKCAEARTGVVEIQPAGGKPPYSYAWNADGLDGAREDELAAGAYEITVSDAAGNTYLLETILTAPDPLRVKITDTRSPSARDMLNGKAGITVSGGVEPYQIQWDNGENGFNAERLSGGLHTVTVSDANACSRVAEIEIQKGKILADLDIEKINVGQTLRIEKLYFAADSSSIQAQSYETLEEIREFLEINQNVVIEIGGHTNNIPDHAYCDRLSLERAENVAAYLYDKGIPHNRILAKGYGKRNPIASNETRAGRARNQRVEIRILSIGE